MKTPKELTANIDQLKTSSTQTSELTEEDKSIVRKFFAAINLLYGAARCQAVWPTQEATRNAMRLWAPDICKYTWPELNHRLMFAKGMMHQAEWKHPDVAMILNGAKQPGASGAAAESYRPASEALAALPPPPQDKAKGQAMLDALRDSLQDSLDSAADKRQNWTAEQRAEIARLEEKHLPYGKYQAKWKMPDGSIEYRPTDIDHPQTTIAEVMH